VLSTIR